MTKIHSRFQELPSFLPRQQTVPSFDVLTLLMVILCFAGSTFGFADDKANQQVSEILRDAKLTSNLQPYVIELFDTDVARLVECGPSAVPELIKTVRNAPMRSLELSLAIDALGELKDNRALPILIEALSYREFHHYSGHHNLPKAIAELGVPAIDKLIPLAETGPAFQRQRAMQTLIEIADPKATDAYLASLRRRDRANMTLAIRALKDLREPRAESPLLKILREEMANENVDSNSICVTIFNALETIGDQNSELPLVNILTNKDSKYRVEAATTLGKMKSQLAMPTLLELLDDKLAAKKPKPAPAGPNVCSSGPPAPLLHDTVIAALANYGKLAAPELLKIAEPNSFRGIAALRALALGGDPSAKELMVLTLSNESLPKHTRVIAAEGLAKISDPSTIDSIFNAIRSEKPPLTMNQYFIKAFVAMGQTARPALDRALNDQHNIVRWTAIKSLCEIGDTRDFKALSAEVSKPRNNGAVAMGSFWELARQHSNNHIDDALWTIASSKESSASYAIEILSQRQNVDRKRLQQVVKTAIETVPYHWQQYALLDSIQRLGIEGLEERLIQWLADKREDIRQAAANAIAAHDLELLAQQFQTQPESSTQMLQALIPHGASPVAQNIVVAALQKPATIPAALKIFERWKWRGAGDEVLKLITDARVNNYSVPAITAMAAIGDQRAIEATIRIRPRGGIRALAPFGHNATEPLIKLLNEKQDIAIEAIEVLRIIGDPRAVQPLIDLLNRPELQPIHHLVVIALGDIGDGAAIDALISQSNNPRVSSHFVWEAIAKLPRDIVIPRMLKMLKNPKTEGIAVFELSQIGTPRALDALRNHLPNASSDEARERIREEIKKDY